MPAKFNQRIGPEIIPPGPTWAEASRSDHLAFFAEAGKRAVTIKRSELARGIGANGRPMAARKRPRPDGANGPVLTPHGEASRTARLMASYANVEAVTLFWRSGHSRTQKLPWGTILGFHARGEVKGSPVRDVRLSKRGIATLKGQMATWWANHHAPRLNRAIADRQTAEDAARKRRKPGIAAKAKRAMEKKYDKLASYFRPRGGGF